MPYLAVGGVGLGVGWGWGSGPLGAATCCPRRRRPFHFFFATWPFLAIRNVRVLGFTTTTDETGLPPDPLLRTENRQIFIANFFFKKKIGANFFLAILNIDTVFFPSPPSHVEGILMKTDEPIECKRSRSWRETALAGRRKHEQRKLLGCGRSD